MSERKSKYTTEYRADAVRLALSPGQTVRGTARDLGLNPATLRYWIRAARPPQPPAPPAPPLTGDEREELVRLRRRVRTLEHEREILKKAAAFFAQESDATR
jgi:transposase